MLCVHIGPGPLGLGLIVEQLERAGFDICLVGPPARADREQRRFGIAFTDPTGGLEYRQVRWACNAASADELPAEVLALVRSSEPLLITCALGERIEERVEFVLDLAAMRPAGAETLLLACENEPHTAYASIAERAGATLTLCRCVVDRICSWPTERSTDARGRVVLSERPRDGQGRRVVRAHPVGEWLVFADVASAALKQLVDAPCVSLAGEADREGLEARKLWVVGGVHMVLALIARLAGMDVLPLDGECERDFIARAQPLMRSISGALASRWPRMAPSDEYLSERIRAFVQSPDTTARVLRRLVRHDLRPLMSRVDERLGAAARAAAQAGEDCDCFYETMALLVTVLSDRRLYYPDPTATILDAAIDEQALELFTGTLSGWLESRRAEALVDELRHALAGHRAIDWPLRA